MASGKIAQIKSVALVSSGKFLEMYDFMVFAYYAKYVAAAFFPATTTTSSGVSTARIAANNSSIGPTPNPPANCSTTGRSPFNPNFFKHASRGFSAANTG